MEVDPIVPNAHAVREFLRACPGTHPSWRQHLLCHSEQRSNTARFTDVRAFGQTVRRAHHVTAWSQSRQSTLRLQPVCIGQTDSHVSQHDTEDTSHSSEACESSRTQQRQRQLPRILNVLLELLWGGEAKVLDPIIILRPVD
jgi:hypothetical protein